MWNRRPLNPAPPFRLVLAITCYILLSCACHTPPTDGPDGALAYLGMGKDGLSRFMDGLLPPDVEVPGPLAMGDFLLGGSSCDLGEELEAALPAYIERQKPDLQVISRQDLDTLLAVQKLQMEDLFQEGGAEPGRLLPARSLLIGFLFPREDGSTALKARILDLESGEILSTARAFFKGRRAQPRTPYDNLPLELQYLVTARIRGVEGEVLLAEGDRVYSGDRLRIRLKPNRPAFLYVFLLDSQGRARLLFPEGGRANARIEAGELLLPSSGTYFRLDRHPGKESLLMAASLEPLERIEALRLRLEEEAAGAAEVMDAFQGLGRRGFVGVSCKLDDGEDGSGMDGILRSYAGVVWRRFELLHLP